MSPDQHLEIASRAMGLASEAISSVRSHERMVDLQFKGVENALHAQNEKYDEIKEMIAAVEAKMEVGFKTYDSKFWSLAITTILTLVGACGTLIYALLSHPKGF